MTLVAHWLILLAIVKKPARDDEVVWWISVRPAGVPDVVVEQLLHPEDGDGDCLT